MRRPRKPQKVRPEPVSLGLKFWAIMNAPSVNRFVDRGKCTELGVKYLEMTEEMVTEEWRGLVRTERRLSRKEWMELWLSGSAQVDEWLESVRRKLGVSS